MFSSFNQLKKASNLGELTKKLVEQSEKLSAASSSKDSRIFTVERDKKTGTGFAIVRFMPPPPDEPSEKVTLVNHNFGINGKYLNENCPKHTPGIQSGPCPICESNRELWATEKPELQEIVRQRKLQTSYYTNVYIVKNPANPELEGRVMLFRFGKKLNEKIENARKPKYEGDTNIVEPFNLFENGANFRIVVKTQIDSKNNKNYPEYSESAFEPKGAILNGDDTKIEKIWYQCHSLQEIIAPDKFHSYDQIQKNLNRVMSSTLNNSVKQQEEELEEVAQVVNDTDIMKELENQYRNHNRATDPEEDEALRAFRELEEMDD